MRKPLSIRHSKISRQVLVRIISRLIKQIVVRKLPDFLNSQ